MKALLPLFCVVFASAIWAGDIPAAARAQSDVITGEALEVTDVEGYTYLRLKTGSEEMWAAISKAPVKKGSKVTIENVMIMRNFESKTLKKTFPAIAFGNLAGTGSTPPSGSAAMMTAHTGLAKTADVADVVVPKAGGPNAVTVAEVITKAAVLKDKTVHVRGKVVKLNLGIMGKNWLHLRDGSGSAVDGTNDILVTTMANVSLGDIVVAQGIVRTNKDFGSGYAYKVLIEEATFQQ